MLTPVMRLAKLLYHIGGDLGNIKINKGCDKMDLFSLQGFIATVGFPIAMVCGLCFFGYKIWKRTQDQNEKREERLICTIETTNILNKELSSTNEKISATNEKLVQHLTKDMAQVKGDVEDIKLILINK